MKIVIKEFNELTTDELYNILKARSEIFVVEQDCAYLDLDDRDKNAVHFFIEEDGKVIAYTRMLFVDGRLSMGRVLVNKNYRRQGLASKVVKATIKYGQDRYDEDKLFIEAQSYLLDFYQGLGFEKISEDFLLDNILHCKMVLDLRA